MFHSFMYEHSFKSTKGGVKGGSHKICLTSQSEVLTKHRDPVS